MEKRTLKARRARADAIIAEMKKIRGTRVKAFRSIPDYHTMNVSSAICTILCFTIITTVVVLWFKTDLIRELLPPEWRDVKGSTFLVLFAYVISSLILFENWPASSFICSERFIHKLECALVKTRAIDERLQLAKNPSLKNRQKNIS